MIFVVFLWIYCYCLLECDVVVSNIKDVKSVSEIYTPQCKNISFDHVTSATNGEYAFLELGSDNIEASITFTDCDFLASHHFINQEAAKQDFDIVVTRTNIGAAFARQIGVKSITFVDCVINLNYITSIGGELTANNIRFVGCKFTGRINGDRTHIFHPSTYSDSAARVDTFSIVFEDCIFNLDKRWNTDDYGTVNHGKQFIIISAGQHLSSAKIRFTRCYTEMPDEELKSLRFIKIAGSDRSKVAVDGSDNGIAIEWAWISSGGEGLYSDPGEWSVVVANSGYSPTRQPQTEDPDDGGDNDSNSNKAWMAAAIVFIILFVLAVAAIVVIILLFKKKYDRSENEKI